MSVLEQVESFPHDGRFYLLEELNETSGFFVTNGCPVYGVCSKEVRSSAPIRTSLLELDTAVKLTPIKNDGTSFDMTFDLIRMLSIPGDRELEAFFTLCRDHSRGNNNLSVRDFFFAASRLFEQETSQRKKDAIGLFGELSLIRYAADRGTDISDHWQEGGSSSKYDFTLPKINVEVKTTTRRELIAKIKHDQLFNDEENYLVFVQIEKTGTGETLSELANSLLKHDNCFNTLESRIALTNELITISERNLMTRFHLKAFHVFKADDINPLESHSERLTSIQYDYDLNGLEELDLSVLLDGGKL